MKTDLHQQSIVSQGMEYLLLVTQELSLARDLKTVTSIVGTSARKLMSADGATFVLKDGNYCFYADEDAIRPLWKGSRFPMDKCVSGWVMLNRMSVSIRDIYLDSRVPHDAYEATFVKSLAMVPIRTLEPIGVIGIYWAYLHTPSDDELKLLQSLADATALALENVRVYEELEQRVKDRTIDLETANKSLEAYSHSVSHDLRAPLRSIRGFFEILYDDLKIDLDQHQKETAQRIFSNVTYMENLIDGLLAFSKMGRQRLSKSVVKMEGLVKEICENFQAQEPSRNIEFNIAPLPKAEADPMLIRQVWTNLLSNAVKYTGKKTKARIEIGFESHSDSLVYFVKDNGAGFDMKYAEHLFGVFQRMHTQRDFKGIGIGLSIVEKIVAKHDGKIWANAVVNQGATFYFRLPRNKAATHPVDG
jgi:K+-sensing histidine kinase KdpD